MVKADGGSLRNSIVVEAAQNFNTSRATVKRVWKRYKDHCLSPSLENTVVVGRKKGSGRKKKWNIDEIHAAMKEVPFSSRRTLAALSNAINVPRSTLHDYMRQGRIKRGTTAVKPMLTAANMQARIDYFASFVDPSCRLFSHLLDIVHVDEKWFYMTELTTTYYHAPDEELPYRRVKHKSHIDKVMFAAAVARPRYDARNHCWWNGLIDITPLIKRIPAQRNSKNRPAGTLETHTIKINS
jgi:hypothetical protein